MSSVAGERRRGGAAAKQQPARLAASFAPHNGRRQWKKGSLKEWKKFNSNQSEWVRPPPPRPVGASFWGLNGFGPAIEKGTDEGSEIWPHQEGGKPCQKYHGGSAVKTSICGRETQLMWTQQCRLSLPLHNECGGWLMAEGGKYECNRWDFKIQRQLFIKTDKTTGHLFTCWSVNVPRLFFVLWRCQVLALLFTCLAGAVVAGLHQQGLSLVDGGALHPFLSAPLPCDGPIWAAGRRGWNQKPKKERRRALWGQRWSQANGLKWISRADIKLWMY